MHPQEFKKEMDLNNTGILLINNKFHNRENI